MKDDLKLYRVYGERGLETIDEYCHAMSAQHAVDRVREWHSYDDVEDGAPPFVVLEVAKVVKGWK